MPLRLAEPLGVDVIGTELGRQKIVFKRVRQDQSVALGVIGPTSFRFDGRALILLLYMIAHVLRKEFGVRAGKANVHGGVVGHMITVDGVGLSVAGVWWGLWSLSLRLLVGAFGRPRPRVFGVFPYHSGAGFEISQARPAAGPRGGPKEVQKERRRLSAAPPPTWPCL